MNRIEITEKMIHVLMEILPQNADTAEGTIAEWQIGKGHMPEAFAVRFPRLALLWHSEAVRNALAEKVTIEAISDAQLECVPMLAE